MLWVSRRTTRWVLKSSSTRRRWIEIHAGSCRTGQSTEQRNSPFQLVEQAEYRANADAFRCSLPPDEIRAAMQAGYTEPWQLAEYFDLEESYIKKALHYWTQCRGIDFNQ